MKILLSGILSLAALAASGEAALAQASGATYCAKLSENDHVSSNGAALTDAGSILRQDRANYHRFELRDYGDQLDDRFGSVEAREQIPTMLRNGRTDPAVLRAIVEGTPDVCVEVAGRAMTVVLASAATERPVAAEGSYPFEGRWDCEVATFTFTPTIYDNGTDRMPIREIQEGSDGSYTLFFDDDYLITLSGFTGTEMGWYSHTSSDNFQCRRLD